MENNLCPIIRENVKRGYLFYQEGFKYKADKYLRKIKCPTLVIYGTKEEEGNKKLNNNLYNKFRTKHKMIKSVSGAYHTLRTKKVINFFVKEVLKWLNKPYENQD